MTLTKRLATLLLGLGTLGFTSVGIANTRPASAPGSSDIANTAPRAEHSKKKAKHQAKRQAKRQRRLAKFDGNHDGRLDKSERLTMKKQRFAKLDRNLDGAVTLREVRILRNAKRNQRLATLSGEKRAKREAKIKANAQKRNQRMSTRFAKRDLDKNGSINWSEFSKMRAKRGRHGQWGRRGRHGQRGQQGRHGQRDRRGQQGPRGQQG